MTRGTLLNDVIINPILPILQNIFKLENKKSKTKILLLLLKPLQSLITVTFMEFCKVSPRECRYIFNYVGPT